MKKKTIDKNIQSKMDNWAKSLPKELREEFRENVIVTGGCIVSMFLQEKINDYDVYFKDPKFLVKYLEYLVKVLKKDYKNDAVEVRVYRGNTYEETSVKQMEEGDRVAMYISSIGMQAINAKEKYHPLMITDNAVTLKGDIQVITRFHGTPEMIHKNFDYVHVRSYWTYKTGVVTPPDALEAILTKELVYRGSLYPIASLIRMRKFLKRGWSINAGQIVKMAFQVSKLDMDNPAVLADQLMGVDMSYFVIFIQRIREMKEQGIEIDAFFVMTLLDEVFENEHTDEDLN